MPAKSKKTAKPVQPKFSVGQRVKFDGTTISYGIVRSIGCVDNMPSYEVEFESGMTSVCAETFLNAASRKPADEVAMRIERFNDRINRAVADCRATVKKFTDEVAKVAANGGNIGYVLDWRTQDTLYASEFLDLCAMTVVTLDVAEKHYAVNGYWNLTKYREELGRSRERIERRLLTDDPSRSTSEVSNLKDRMKFKAMQELRKLLIRVCYEFDRMTEAHEWDVAGLPECQESKVEGCAWDC